jgi:hypothetical protein
MNEGKYVFSQIISFVDHHDFERCVERYNGNYRSRSFSCWQQFLCMAFGQLTHRESLSDTVLCLNSNTSKLYHMGIGRAVTKTTLSRANETRDWRIYADFALSLIEEARRLYGSDSQLDIELKQNVFAIDSTVIDLCLSVYSWARFRKTKAAVKLHVQLDLKNSIPCFIHISEGRVHDVNMLDLIDFEPEGFYVMDRGYKDFERLYRLTQAKAFFVTRAINSLAFERLYSSPVDKQTGLRCDQIIRFANPKPARRYPDKLRRIKFFDADQDRTFVFLTNNFDLAPLDIARLYKHRWQIELFFKWIKQHLKIKSFWGYDPNAVKTQVWIAISVYVIVAIVKKKLNLKLSMYEILQILSINIFDKTPINTMLQHPNLHIFKEHPCNQLTLFDF